MATVLRLQRWKSRTRDAASVGMEYQPEEPVLGPMRSMSSPSSNPDPELVQA
jgi:hypothetical protein